MPPPTIAIFMGPSSRSEARSCAMFVAGAMGGSRPLRRYNFVLGSPRCVGCLICQPSYTKADIRVARLPPRADLGIMFAVGSRGTSTQHPKADLDRLRHDVYGNGRGVGPLSEASRRRSAFVPRSADLACRAEMRWPLCLLTRVGKSQPVPFSLLSAHAPTHDARSGIKSLIRQHLADFPHCNAMFRS